MIKTGLRWQPIEYLLVLLFSVNLYFHANKGGTGFNIPGNILVWMVAVSIISYSLWRLAGQQRIYWPKMAVWFFIFPLLSLYGGFLSGIEIAEQWLFRVLFIWGGLLFFFAVFQFHLSMAQIDRLLLTLVFFAMLHGIAAGLQVLFGAGIPFGLPVNPYHVPTGIFQQINVQASFQATVVMVIFWLLTRPMVRLGPVKIRVFLYVALSISTFVITCSGSRVAFLGLILALPLMMASRWLWIKKDKKRWLFILLLITSVITAGSILEKSRGISNAAAKMAAINAGYSGSIRLGMYKIALDLAGQAPWLGHGIGSFVRVFQLAKPDFYAQHPEGRLPESRVGHPHNELIYWLIEGGILMTFGLILLAIAVFISVWRLPVSRRYAYMALLIPIVLHTQVELPFYISSLHWFVFLFLLFMTLKPTVISAAVGFSFVFRSVIQISALSLFVIANAFLLHSMASSLELKRYIHHQTTGEPFVRALNNPYFRELVTQHMMRALLFKSMQRGITENVRLYAEWGEKTLPVNPHIVIYKTTAQAYFYLKEHDKYCAIAEEGHAVYPGNELLNKMIKQCRNHLSAMK
ncbi:PglL family O-oligosaccharyltransferase [methane-oxidizing endosymbiont of Gigantopelta aegis]|uniref:PglL family O-oligosaccharyltransferase n=1 Tax=methane-oxidizing endosymbiont of Gigantopelta aegis TaxID=2794938 RepID=UPI0018DDACA3|nr:Wzy polymerase domain-containing protein [methane-oxidizing endosymbiont of Gigantopelta aegis]